MSFIAFGLGGSAADLLRLGLQSGDAPTFDAGAVWSYTLSNGKTAGQNLVEVNAGIAALLAAPNCLETGVQGPYTAADALRMLLAVAVGKTTIAAAGGGAATVEFRAADDSNTTVTADMQGSERIDVTLNPEASS